MSIDSMPGTDCLVIGSGVIGLSLAYELLRAGRQVRLLDRGEPGSAATSVAAGMLAPISEAESNESELIRFGQDSLERYPAFVAEVEKESGESCGYETDGTLWIAVNSDDREELRHLATTLESKSLGFGRLDAKQVAAREPHLSGRVISGLLVEQDHQIDPRALTRALVRAIRGRGGTITTGADVREIVVEAGRVRGVVGSHEDREFQCPCREVILAAGAWCDHGIRTPEPALGIRPVKGQVLRLHGTPLLRHVVRTPDVYLVPRRKGELLVGATMEEQGFDTKPTAGAVMDLLRHAWEVLPGSYDLELVEISAGLRPVSASHLPIIGRATTEGLWIATGHYRHGILLAPATAHYLANWIVSGQPEEALSPFLAEQRSATEDTVNSHGG